jgi:hypothetical protein
MTRRRAEFWMLWLLPLLVMRLLLPTGVMPARSTHGFALVLCSVQHLRSAPQPGHAHAESLCPFAAAASAAPPSAPIQPALPLALPGQSLIACTSQCNGQSGTPRSQLARAPPSFS